MWEVQKWVRGPESGLLNLDEHLRSSLTLGLALGTGALGTMVNDRN